MRIKVKPMMNAVSYFILFSVVSKQGSPLARTKFADVRAFVLPFLIIELFSDFSICE